MYYFVALFKVHVFTLKIENMKLLTHDHDDASPVGGPGLPPAGDRVGGHNLGPGGKEEEEEDIITVKVSCKHLETPEYDK